MAISSDSYKNDQPSGQREIEPRYDSLKRAADLIEESVRRDNVLPLLEDTFNSQISGGYTVIEPVTSALKAWQPFDLRQTTPLPDALFDAYDTLEVKCQMGLFTQIARAWISIDDTIFLWDYTTTDCQTIPLRQTVIAAEVVDVRPGVLVDNVKHLLVVVCSSHISLFGLCPPGALSPQTNDGSKNVEQNNDYILYNIGEINCAATGVNGIIGAKSGRIFIYGKAGLWEIVYQSQERIIRRGKCWKINLTTSMLSDYLPFGGGGDETEIISAAIDDERRTLYTLNGQNTIDVYYLERDGQGFTKTASRRNLLSMAQNLTQPTALLNPRNAQIIKLSVVKSQESRVVHLVALTKHGVRLYLTTWPGYGFYRQPSPTPSCLDLVHCRLPPAFQGANGPHVVYKATHALMNHGVFASAIVSNGDQDILLLTNQDYGQAAKSTGDKSTQQPPFNEQATTLQLSGQVWALKEQSHPIIDGSLVALTDKGTALNELALQTNFPSRSLLAFAHNGLSVIDVRWPVDILRDLLRVHATVGGDAVELTNFVESYGRRQSCAMAIFLAADILGEKRKKADHQAHTIVNGADVQDIAVRFLIDFGGKPSLTNGDSSIIYEGSGSGTANSNQNTKTLPSTSPSYSPSARKEALSLCLSRILRSVWYKPVSRSSPTALDPQRQISNLPEPLLVDVQSQLIQLERFLVSYRNVFTGNPVNPMEADQLIRAYSAEYEDVDALIILTSRTVQAISFVLFLMDYKFQDVTTGLAPQSKSDLKNMTFGRLVVSPEGRAMINSLVTTLVDIQIRQQVPIDSIFDVLQRRCGSLCPPDGNILFKAVEQLKRANEAASGGERLGFLQEALNLFQRSANRLDLERLQELARELTRLQYAVGAVALAEKCASAWDPQDQGMQLWREGGNEADPRMTLLKQRQDCYGVVCETLHLVDEAVGQAISKEDPNQTAILNERSATYQKVFESHDEMLHRTVYRWMLERGQHENLLELRTPFLENWMKSSPQSLDKWDLLWQHYTRRNEPYRAAETLLTIATSNFPIDLERRVESLSYAAGNARAATGSADSSMYKDHHPPDIAGLLEHVEDLLDVAKVQMEIVQVLESPGDDGHAEILKSLKASLWTISELYEKATEPLNLHEQSLVILQTSGHDDPDLIYDTWSALIASSAEALQADENQAARFEASMAAVGKRFYRQSGQFSSAIFTKAVAGWLIAPKPSMSENGNGGLSLGSGILARTLIGTGFSTEDALEAIGQLLTSRVTPFSSKDAQSKLIEEMIHLMQTAKTDQRTKAGHPESGLKKESKVHSILLKYTDFAKQIKAPRALLEKLEGFKNR